MPAGIGRWLIRRRPETVLYSRLPQAEILRRVDQALAEQRAERKSRSLSSVLRAKAKGVRSIDADWDTERLALRLGRVDRASSASPTMLVTFEQAGSGTRLRISGASDGLNVLFAGIFLIFDIVAGWGYQHQENADLAVLGDFLTHCADLNAEYEPGRNEP